MTDAQSTAPPSPLIHDIRVHGVSSHWLSHGKFEKLLTATMRLMATLESEVTGDIYRRRRSAFSSKRQANWMMRVIPATLCMIVCEMLERPSDWLTMHIARQGQTLVEGMTTVMRPDMSGVETGSRTAQQ